MINKKRYSASKKVFGGGGAIGFSCEELPKIHTQKPDDPWSEYYDKNENVVRGGVTGLLPLPWLINKIARATIYPRVGNGVVIHNNHVCHPANSLG